VQEQSVTEWATSASTWLSFPELRAFDTQSVSIAYSVSRYQADLPVGPTVDPYATVPIEPFRGILSTLSLGYNYSNVEGSYYGISPEKGYRLGASLEVANDYTPGGMRGRDYLLLNAEYRLPIAYIDRGWSALPLYFRTLSMAAFADYGGAFDRVDLEKPFASYHLGIGAEMWLSLVFGYRVGGTLRVGHARGTDSKAVKGGQTYVVVASPF
jgi:hypothetical protein